MLIECEKALETEFFGKIKWYTAFIIVLLLRLIWKVDYWDEWGHCGLCVCVCVLWASVSLKEFWGLNSKHVLEVWWIRACVCWVSVRLMSHCSADPFYLVTHYMPLFLGVRALSVCSVALFNPDFLAVLTSPYSSVLMSVSTFPLIGSFVFSRAVLPFSQLFAIIYFGYSKSALLPTLYLLPTLRHTH